MSKRDILNESLALHMRTDPIRLRVDQSAHEALETARHTPSTGRVVYFYVVDEENRLRGVVPTRRLLMAAPDQPITELMDSRVIAIPQAATVLDACEFFALHRLLAFPVVDTQRRLIGTVDVDLYAKEQADLNRREDNESLFLLIGVHISDAEQRRIGLSFWRRFPWLLCNVAGGLLAGLLADVYADVSTLLLVTPFIPVVLTLAESVSIQSVTLALHSIQGQPPTWGALRRKVVREVLLGIALGVACGLLVGMIALPWKGSLNAALSVFLGIGGGGAAAAVIGLVLPYLLKLSRRDPKVAAGPVALAASDMVALFLYFNLGRWLLL